jgi:hypothetical protein
VRNESIKDIAAQLGITEQTVKNQLQHAYDRLKSRIKDYDSSAIVVFFVASHLPNVNTTSQADLITTLSLAPDARPLYKAD